MYDFYKAGDIRNVWISGGKIGVDLGFMFIKSNSYVLGASFIYNISDGAGVLNFKKYLDYEILLLYAISLLDI